MSDPDGERHGPAGAGGVHDGHSQSGAASRWRRSHVLVGRVDPDRVGRQVGSDEPRRSISERTHWAGICGCELVLACIQTTSLSVLPVTASLRQSRTQAGRANRSSLLSRPRLSLISLSVSWRNGAFRSTVCSPRQTHQSRTLLHAADQLIGSRARMAASTSSSFSETKRLGNQVPSDICTTGTPPCVRRSAASLFTRDRQRIGCFRAPHEITTVGSLSSGQGADIRGNMSRFKFRRSATRLAARRSGEKTPIGSRKRTVIRASNKYCCSLQGHHRQALALVRYINPSCCSSYGHAPRSSSSRDHSAHARGRLGSRLITGRSFPELIFASRHRRSNAAWPYSCRPAHRSCIRSRRRTVCMCDNTGLPQLETPDFLSSCFFSLFFRPERS